MTKLKYVFFMPVVAPWFKIMTAACVFVFYSAISDECWNAIDK